MAQMKKEQMQLLIMGAVVVGGALFAAVNFLLVPIINQWKSDKAKAIEIRAMVEEVRVVVRSRVEVLDQFSAERERLDKVQAHIPRPVLGNYLLDMDEQIRKIAADNELDVISVTDNDVAPINYADDLCRIYRVRVTAEGGLNDFTAFLEDIESSNPLLVVSSVNIVPQEGKQEKHDIRIILGWLIWGQPEQLPGYITNLEASVSG